MEKRAQITLFVIIGLFLLAVVSLVLFNLNNLKIKSDITKTVKLPSDVEVIRQDIELCFKEAGENALIIIGLQGGYVISPLKSYKAQDIYIPYYSFEGKSLIPDLKDVESEISAYVSNYMSKCVNDIKNFDVKKERISISSNIEENKVIVSANYPLTLTKGNITFKLIQPYESEYPSRLKQIYLIAKNITNSNLKQDYIIDFDSLRNNMNITISLLEENTLIYTIKDDVALLNNKPYVFQFAAKLK